MPAVAARSASARASAAPARRPAPRRVAQPARPRPKPVVGPVGRTAGAVGTVAEWGLVHRLTRGRLWIGVLATLLVGIVAINVMALSFSAASSKTAGNADELKRVNSSLRAQIAGGLSTDRLQRKAQASGLHGPNPGSIRYLQTGSGDAATAAKRLSNGSITVAGVSVTDPSVDPITGEPTTP
ncbi:hypothetical protein BH10ACT11_BH10ACT11_18570 [soil metagenome]